MRPHLRINVSRISNIRPLRPPSLTSSRFISTKSSLKASNTRPQIPFLQSAPKATDRGSLFRRISTKKKTRIASQLRVIGWSLLIIWTGGAAVAIGHGLVQEVYYERLYPCPQEWKFSMKHSWRSAQHEITRDKFGQKLANWASVGGDLNNLISTALKDPEVKPNVDWDTTIPGIDGMKDWILQHPVSSLEKLPRVGEDISRKSEEWKNGYFETWMSYATAAEKHHDWVKDKTRNLAFSRRYMVGPSNPDPTPVPPSQPAPPLEENCVPCFEPPSFFYTHVLTTKGFSPRQRIDAALAWASWMDFQGDKATAAKLNAWCLDQACSSLRAEGIEPGQILNQRTCVIRDTAPFITPNLLKVCTQIGTTEARSNNLSSALNIFISVLRARRSAPEAQADKQYKPHPPEISMTSFQNLMRFIRSVTNPPPPPPLPGSGNEPYVRTEAGKCDEAAIMTYIGEILFAISAQSTGLSWTREAVSQAEAGYQDRKMDPYSRIACAQCVEAGLGNWLQMTDVLIVEEKKRKIFDHNGHWVGIRRSWLDKLKAVFGAEGHIAKLVDSGDWREEKRILEMRRAAFLERRMVEDQEGKHGPFL